MKGPFEKPPKESGKTMAHLTKEVILFQVLLSIFVLPTAKSLTLLLQILNEQFKEVISNNNSSANSIERSKEVINNTMKPVLSGHRIKRTPSIKRTVAEVPEFISLICFK